MLDISLTYIVLAHERPARVERLVDKLLGDDSSGQVIVHFDKKSGEAPFQQLVSRYVQEPRCHILTRRARCGWGQWSLVEATLEALRYAQATHKTDYYYLLSEYCYPAQPLNALKQHLKQHHGTNFIECEDSGWIKGGIREDRYLYHHFLNKRQYPRLHRWMYKAQKWLGLKRKVPADLSIRFGSQWWCLTQSTIEQVLQLAPTYRQFFKWVWIPDECFIQSLTFNFQSSRIAQSLTFKEFGRFGEALYFPICHKVPLSYYFFRKVE